MTRIILREMHKNVLLGGRGMLEMQKDWAVMKEDRRTGKKKMVDKQMVWEEEKKHWGKQSWSILSDQLKFECEWKKTVTKSIKRERERETVLEFKLTDPESV